MLERHLLRQGSDSVLELVHETNLNSVRITLDTLHILLELAHSVGPRQAVWLQCGSAPFPCLNHQVKHLPGFAGQVITEHTSLNTSHYKILGDTCKDKDFKEQKSPIVFKTCAQ